MEKQSRPNKKQSKRIKDIERIQSVAFNARARGSISKNLTFQQALSILLRSQELISETEGITHEEKARQIDECWRQKREQLKPAQNMRR